MKKFINIFLVVIFLIILIIAYLSVIGVETKSFNEKISNQIERVNPEIKLELKKVKFLFNPLSFKINIKTLGPNIKTKDKVLELESIKTSILIKSFINKNFFIDNLEISTKLIKLRDIIKFARSVEDSPQLFLLEKITKQGYLIADLDLEFDEKGEVKKDFNIRGIIKEANFDILSNYNLKKLNFIFNINDNNYDLSNFDFIFNDIKFNSDKINIEDKKNTFFFQGDFRTSPSKIDKENELIKILNNEFNQYKIKDVLFSSNNKFSFNLDKKFDLKNLIINSKINLENLIIENNFNLEYFFPKYKKIIKLRDNNLELKYSKKKFEINGSGDVFLQNYKDKVQYKFLKNEKTLNFNLDYSLNENPFTIDLFD